MKTKLLFTFSLGFFSLCTAAQGWEWGRGVSNAYGANVCTDAAGNVYVAGAFTDTVSFGLTTAYSSGSSDFFLAKYDANGNVIWVKTSGNSGLDEGFAINADVFSNIYVIGNFNSQTLSFDSITITNNSGYNTFVVKYDSSGTALWAKKFSGQPWNISNDAIGNVYFTASDTIFKYDPTGNEIWKTKADAGFGLSTDAAGNTYITGGGIGAIVDTITSSSYNFIARINPDGHVQWLKEISTGNGRSISADTYGNVFTTGSFNDTISFDSIALFNSGASGHFYLARYDSSGNIIWAKQSPDSGYTETWTVSSDALGYTYIAGKFYGTASFDTILVTDTNGDLFVAKYDFSGNAVLVATANGFSGGWVNAVWADGFGNAYVTGYNWSDTCIFNSDTLLGKGLMYLAKVNSFPTGIEEKNRLSNDNLLIYPNPSANKISFSQNFPSASIQIFNLPGEKIYSGKFEKELDVSSLPTGIYIVEVTAGEQNVRAKFVKE